MTPPYNPRWENDVPNWARERWLRDDYAVLPSVYSRQRIEEYNRVVAHERLSVPEEKDEYGYG